jgi:23S rRNA G2445 N2-methylase RlmL
MGTLKEAIAAVLAIATMRMKRPFCDLMCQLNDFV